MVSAGQRNHGLETGLEAEAGTEAGTERTRTPTRICLLVQFDRLSLYHPPVDFIIHAALYHPERSNEHEVRRSDVAKRAPQAWRGTAWQASANHSHGSSMVGTGQI